MPPKKKVKEAEVPQQIQPEPQQQQEQIFRIPKKPFYRSVHLNSHEKVKQIQIKLWKINSLKAPDFLDARPQRVYRLSNKQRVFKNLRKLDYDRFATYKLKKINELISKSWRLEKFMFSDWNRTPVWMRKFVTSRLNPHVKDFFWKMYPSQESIKESIDGWKSLVDCNIWFVDPRNSPVLVLNTKKIRGLKRFIKGSNQNQVIESVEMLSLDILPDKNVIYLTPKKKDIFNLSSMDASQFPNLKTLKVSFSNPNSMEQLDFLKNYPQLITLFLRISDQETSSFEFLSALSNLKQLTLHSMGPQEKPNTLPVIHSLERLEISCSPNKFSAENLQEFLVSNKNLKSLEVQFPLRDDYLIFHESLILPIETLNLNIYADNSHSRKTIMKKLAGFLSKNQQIKSLKINLYGDFPMDQSEILQKGITTMTGLEHLAWCHGLSGELKDMQLKDFKKIFVQNPGIQKLELNFGQGLLMSRSSSSFIDGLLCLKNLKYFDLKIGFYKISPVTFSKFLQFLRFLVFENAAIVKLSLQGISKEEIDRLLAQKCSLWQTEYTCK